MKHALILVDIQNDFLPGGALAVPDGDAVISPANELIHSGRFDVIVATQDWHPPNHQSFAVQHAGRSPGEVIDLHGLTQVMWPVHCVQQTRGAQFADGLDTDAIAKVFQKGQNPEVDSYSGFFDNGRRASTGMGEWLTAQGITAVSVCGLATDYCVKFTALDAVSEGFATTLYVDACRGVELTPGDCASALSEMEAAGVRRGDR